jgi:hypothetical protein
MESRNKGLGLNIFVQKPVLQRIIGHLCPWDVDHNAVLVCKAWKKIVYDMDYQPCWVYPNSLTKLSICWTLYHVLQNGRLTKLFNNWLPIHLDRDDVMSVSQLDKKDRDKLWEQRFQTDCHTLVQFIRCTLGIVIPGVNSHDSIIYSRYQFYNQILVNLSEFHGIENPKLSPNIEKYLKKEKNTPARKKIKIEKC